MSSELLSDRLLMKGDVSVSMGAEAMSEREKERERQWRWTASVSDAGEIKVLLDF